MQMTRFVFFRLEKHFNDDSIKPTNLRHFMSLLYQRSYFYYTQITKNFKRNTLSDNTADFSHQRYGPRNQPQDNERIPDPIRQCIVTVIPPGEQRWHEQRIQKRQAKVQKRCGVKQYRQEQTACPKYDHQHGTTSFESLCHVILVRKAQTISRKKTA